MNAPLLLCVNDELDNHKHLGVTTKVNFCPWGTLLVITPRSDGRVRLCADYKVTVNPLLEPVHYPIPRTGELFTKIHGSKYFCILDLTNAYLHIPLDDESKKIAAISMHCGTYPAERLFLGLSIAPAKYHAITAPIINSIPNCIAYFDDLLIFGKTKAQCADALSKAFETLDKFNIKLNKKKCKFFLRRLKYLGYIISENGLEKDPEKMKAIEETPVPANVNGSVLCELHTEHC